MQKSVYSSRRTPSPAGQAGRGRFIGERLHQKGDFASTEGIPNMSIVLTEGGTAMEKRIAALSCNPHTISLTDDRKCSIFIDPKSRAIFVDEGDGDGRMNGVVFSPGNEPTFSVQPSEGPDHQLILDYAGIQYLTGISDDASQLQSWAESANSLLLPPREGLPFS
jgi:hypothetical protein